MNRVGWVYVAALLVAACSKSQADAPKRPPAHVKAMKLEPSEVIESSEYIATIKSRASVVVQPQIAGHVTDIFVKPGDTVKTGAPLLQIDPAKQQAAFYSSSAATEIVRADLERARATVTSLEASRTAKQSALTLAEQQHGRSTALLQKNAIPQAEFDQTAATVDQARADLAAIEAQIKAQRAALESANKSLQQAQASARQQQVELQYYKLVAPFDGVVGDIPVKVGDYVTPTTKLTSVDQNTGLEAYVSVPIEQAPRLRLDLPVKLLDGDGKPLADSKVSFVSPSINEDTQSVLVKTKLDAAPPGMKTAQFVRAKVIWASHPGLKVPMTAIARFNGQPFAFVVQDGPASTVHQVPLGLGDIDGNMVAVTKGLSAHDLVVVSGLQKLGEGVPVIVDP